MKSNTIVKSKMGKGEINTTWKQTLNHDIHAAPGQYICMHETFNEKSVKSLFQNSTTAKRV